MNEAAELFIKVTGDVSDAMSAMGQVEGEVKKVSDTAEQSGGGFSKLGAIATGAFQGIGMAIGNFGIGMAQQGVSMIIDNIGNSIELASNKAEAASKAQVLFGDSYHIIEEASKNAATSVGVSSGAYLDLAGNVGNLVTNFGIAGDAGADMSKDIVQLAADMGSFNNASTTDVVEAIGAAFRGETEPIRKYGVMLDEATIKAKAMEMGLIHQGDALDKTSKMQASYALILEQTTAAQGDFARTSDGYANAARINQAKVEESMTKLGEVIKPIAQMLQGFASDILAGVFDMITNVVTAVQDWVDANQPLIHTIEDLIGQVGNLYKNYLSFVFDLLGKIADVASHVLGPALDALGAVFRFVGDAVHFLIDAIGAGVDALHNVHRAIDPNMAAMEDLQTQFKTAGEQAGLTSDQIADAWEKAKVSAQNGGEAATGSVEDFIAHYKQAESDAQSEDMREGFRATGLDIQTTMATTATAVTDSTDEMKSALSGLNKGADDAWTAFQQAPQASVEETKARIDELKDRITQLNEVDLATIGPAAYAAWEAAKSATEGQIASLQQYLDDTGPHFADPIAKGIDEMNMAAVERMQGPDGMLATAMKIGTMVPEDIATGMNDNSGAVLDAADRLIDLLKNGMSPAQEAMKLEGKKYIEAVQKGMESQIPGAKESAQAVAVNAIKVIEQAANGSPDSKGLKAIGQYYDSLLAGGMDDKSIAVALAGAGVADDVITKLTGYAPDFNDEGVAFDAHLAAGIDKKSGLVDTAVTNATDPMRDQPTDKWGSAMANEWADALAHDIRVNKDNINRAIHWAMAGMESNSPPKEGPIKNIDKWGKNLGGLWITKVAEGIHDGKDAVDIELDRVRGTLKAFDGATQGDLNEAIKNLAKGHGGLASKAIDDAVKDVTSRIYDATAAHHKNRKTTDDSKDDKDTKDTRDRGRSSTSSSTGHDTLDVNVKHDITPAFAALLKKLEIDEKSLLALLADADKELAWGLKQQRGQGRHG